MATIVEDDRALLSGSSWWGSGTVGKSAFITYSFENESYEQVAGPSHSNAFQASFKPLTEAEKSAAREALKQWGDASGIRFFEADPGRGDIRLATYDLGKDPTGSTAAGDAYYRSVELVDVHKFVDRGGVARDDGVGFPSRVVPNPNHVKALPRARRHGPRAGPTLPPIAARQVPPA